MSRFKTIEDVWSFLNDIPMFQKSGAAASNFSLDNIRFFCERLGDPQDEFKSIHVAGTNGKGTTCYLLEQIYAQSGYKTGMFTSPHLLRYNERVRIDQQEISDEDILEFFQAAESIFDDIYLSYFEISTALAFWYFARQQVDVAIIETGLGGRLDSTNILTPEVSVITSIGLDHQDILGDTTEKIAREKAGIIKEDKPVVIGDISGIELSVIKSVAYSKSSEIFESAVLHPEWKAGTLHLKSQSITLKNSFHEKVNRWNVAMAWKVTELLDDELPVKIESKKQAIESFPGAPARFEKLHPEYEWYFSGSHNKQALESSLETIKRIKPKEDWVLFFSVMKDKWNPELPEVYSGFKEAFFVEQEGERAKKFDEIKDQMNVQKVDEINAKIILKELKTELVIFMGSFYFYDIAKRWTTDVS